MAEVTFNTENLIAGDIKTDQVYLKADTYYRGMILTYDAVTDAISMMQHRHRLTQSPYISAMV